MDIRDSNNMMENFKGLFWVYILKLNNGKYYTGMTNDLDRRLKEHRSGQSKSTRKHLPAELVWMRLRTTRLEARVLEVKIKSRGARRFMKTYG